MEPEKLVKKFIDNTREISELLYDGNDVSQRMGRVLNISMNVLEKSPTRFKHMRDELFDVYNDMSKTHNKMYQDLGGTLGSGEYVESDIDDLEGKTEVNIPKILDGISPEGFMALQMSIMLIRELARPDIAPFKTTVDEAFEQIEWSMWLTLMCVYQAKQRERVLKIISKYDPKAS
jgi:hypothetical protein